MHSPWTQYGTSGIFSDSWRNPNFLGYGMLRPYSQFLKAAHTGGLWFIMTNVDRPHWHVTH